MMSSWTEPSLEDAPLQIIDGDRGKAYPKNSDYSAEGHCLFLNAGNVTSSGFNFSECQFLSEQKDDELRKGKLARNDVVLTTRGTLGNVAYYGNGIDFSHVRINSGMVILRTDQTLLSPAFLYGYLRSPSFESQVEQLRSGVAQPQLPIRDLSKIKIPLPPINVQERIVEVFSSYDNLIENNRRRMALLEDSARLLYCEWFVRLRFPGYEHTRIIDGVPDGWQWTTISSLGKVITGKTPSTKDYDNFGTLVPFIKTPDMHVSSIVMFTEEYLSEKGANSQKNKMLPPNSILVACIGAKLGVVSLNGLESQTNQQINAVVPANECLTYYAYFTLKDFREKLLAIGGGATMPNVNKTKFESMSIVVPAQYLLDSFHETVKHNFEQIKTLILMNKKLETARDLLLPRLMSGEIVV